ncbi:hypothetical protein [Pannonibacter sp. SL95]|uniref:hypothetical protein n=1 Tax=Pannonibacter sp. SL95 TaxID=2995153 RepID=UPI0022723FF0|nr:hypothetical protein [Pannonibacter sp. SL95]MCY1707277.1 hypothetical protein [Pannonibacter sp. SL95]
MTEHEIPQSLRRLPEGRIRSAGEGLIWRTRVLSGSRTSTGVALAIDVNRCRDWAPRTDRRTIGALMLRLVPHLIEPAVREGLWAELRPAHACHDPKDRHWTCAALLHLARQAPRNVTISTLLPTGPKTAHGSLCQG